MAFDPQLISILQQHADALARARFLLTTQRAVVINEMARSANVIKTSAPQSEELNDKLGGLIGQILSGNVPEAEEERVLQQLFHHVLVAEGRVTSLSQEVPALMAEAQKLAALVDEKLLNDLPATAARLGEIREVISPTPEPEPEPEP